MRIIKKQILSRGNIAYILKCRTTYSFSIVSENAPTERTNGLTYPEALDQFNTMVEFDSRYGLPLNV